MVEQDERVYVCEAIYGGYVDKNKKETVCECISSKLLTRSQLAIRQNLCSVARSDNEDDKAYFLTVKNIKIKKDENFCLSSVSSINYSNHYSKYFISFGSLISIINKD